MSFFKNQKAVTLLFSLLCGILTAVLYLSVLGYRVEFYFHDLWYSVRGVKSAPSDIAVVAMDEMSYRNLKVPLNQPWPRALHAKLIDKLASYGAKRVVFDVLFLDQGVDPAADEALAAALKKIPVVLGVESVVQQVGGAGGSFALEELLEPYPPFKKAAEKTALVSLPDDSGYIRHFLTTRTERTAGLPTLSEAAAGIDYQKDKVPDRDDIINYYGPSHTIPTLSYYQVLEEEVPLQRSLVEGKTVFVGLSLRTDIGPAQKDVFKNPFNGSPIFGVEVHATAAGNLKNNGWMRRLSSGLETIVMSVGAALGSLAIASATPTIGAIAVIGAALLWAIVAFIGFINCWMIPGALVTCIIFPFVFLLATFRSFVIAHRSELKLRSAFELYVSPDMVQQLHKGETEVKLGGQKVWATALFTDIESFTDVAEDLAPEKVAEMLNAYFTEVMDVIFKHKGTLIKFIGDSVFVIWGAPIHVDNHAILALTAAEELQAKIQEFNSRGQFPPLKTRVGIHTGPMVVGNLGSGKRFDYTAIGDSVNLASRIEGLNKLFGTSFLFSEAVRKDSGIGKEGVVPVGDIRVKGKKDAVSLYTRLNPPLSDEISTKVSQALRAFQRGLWDDAVRLFKELSLADNRLAKMSSFYEQYVGRIRNEIDPLEWNGEIVLDSK